VPLPLDGCIPAERATDARWIVSLCWLRLRHHLLRPAGLEGHIGSAIILWLLAGGWASAQGQAENEAKYLNVFQPARATYGGL